MALREAMISALATSGPLGWLAAADIRFNGSGITDRLTNTVLQRMGATPTLQDEVAVQVYGDPGVTKQQLYFLALATANGIVRRFGNLFDATSPAYGEISIEYDAADHWVRASIAYKWSMAAVVADTLNGPTIASQFERMAVYRGPQCDVVGGNFDFVSNIGEAVDPLMPLAGRVGIPTSAVSPGAPVLPLAGQPILTACPTTPTPRPASITQNPAPSVALLSPGPVIPSPNPQPPGDNRSRGCVVVPPGTPDAQSVPGPSPQVAKAKCCEKLRALIPLVYAALTAPASNAQLEYADPKLGPGGG